MDSPASLGYRKGPHWWDGKSGSCHVAVRKHIETAFPWSLRTAFPCSCAGWWGRGTLPFCLHHTYFSNIPLLTHIVWFSLVSLSLTLALSYSSTPPSLLLPLSWCLCLPSFFAALHCTSCSRMLFFYWSPLTNYPTIEGRQGECKDCQALPTRLSLWPSHFRGKRSFSWRGYRYDYHWSSWSELHQNNKGPTKECKRGASWLHLPLPIPLKPHMTRKVFAPSPSLLPFPWMAVAHASLEI